MRLLRPTLAIASVAAIICATGAVHGCSQQDHLRAEEAAVGLEEFKNVPSEPPILNYAGSEREAYVLDWKSRERTLRIDKTGTVPETFQAPPSLARRFFLQGLANPVFLQVAIFHRPASDVDPLTRPDRTLTCHVEQIGDCRTSRNQEAIHIELTEDVFPQQGKVVVSVSSEFYAEAELNSERFINIIGWVLEIDLS
ncbi:MULTISPECIES: hypothetical protein [unclassified Arthrobacter]|uniref:hypothetical protein n=1 Tax=unclassified Arthrobacter TaxID=235627 RepID=UPI00254DF604|nr:hypothetical protein [Arthrobacter sp. efr-133-TYG-120]